MNKVGRSQLRTPYKHFLLNALLGKVNGSLSTGKSYAVPPLFCVDLCAGDGVCNDDHNSSPAIFQKHCGHPFGRKNNASLTLIEKQPKNYDMLLQNVDLDNYWTTVILGDAREYSLPKFEDNRAVFIHCDPNNVNQTPLTHDFVRSWTKCTTYLVTLGCNAEGIKRLPIEHREKWYEYVNLLIGHLPDHHDLLLFRLVRDSAQWAYACNLPRVWADEWLEIGVRAGDKIWHNGVDGTSYRNDQVGFEQRLHHLFLTKSEVAK